MPPSREALDKLKSQIENARLQDTVAKQVAKVFKALLDFANKTKIALERRVDSELDSFQRKVDARLARVRDGKDGKDGAKGEKGDKGDKGEPGQSVEGPPGRDGSADMAEDIRNKLELLTGDERLKIEAISGVDKLLTEIETLKARPISPGRALLQLLVGGAKKGAVQYLNLVAGSGVTLSYASAHGRNDVTISAGGASVSPIAMTGDIDDSNVNFTAASEPTLVVINGASYRHGKGVTISGTTITLDNPVGTGGDIYGL